MESLTKKSGNNVQKQQNTCQCLEYVRRKVRDIQRQRYEKSFSTESVVMNVLVFLSHFLFRESSVIVFRFFFN